MNQASSESGQSSPPAPPSWELWRSFLAVVEHGSLSGAARALKLTQPSISRHVNALEQCLNAALFTRSRHGLNPTPLATSLLAQVQSMASAAESLLRSASAASAQAQGIVRITASEMVGTMVLPPMLAAFREQHPAIVVELALSNRNDDLLLRQADIAVRMQRPTQAALVARHVGSVKAGLFAHQSYARRHGLPGNLQALFAHPLIGVDRDETPLQHPALAKLGLSRESFALRCDSDVAQWMAMRAGFGIGACQHSLVAEDPQYLHVLPEEVQWNYEMWLAMHEDQRDTLRIRLLFDHLANGLQRHLSQTATAPQPPGPAC
ncbi:LysR family transcriptional regulator [Comamonas sp. Y6]|uniref:LysR family transcriptional regulator n=1 Tax=Comamonas resistens TaxID=3046670 RepID=A0ABY8SS05_9BURK|nr:LysR family transcriptional regulator [Comamonas resistens]MDL5038603.1 LysR family transcriptional regulator [Comamonas resistens]WHS64086.1 LysR family transcriptional regulator [Comamonas resistens]